MTTTKTAQFEALYAEAHTAGLAAAQALVPEPMHVVQVGAGGEILKRYPPVLEGACGFAWIVVKPATSSFGRWLRARGHSKAYGGGVQIWVSQFGQSYERKSAYASAFAEVLTGAGITAYAQSRLD